MAGAICAPNHTKFFQVLCLGGANTFANELRFLPKCCWITFKMWSVLPNKVIADSTIDYTRPDTPTINDCMHRQTYTRM